MKFDKMMIHRQEIIGPMLSPACRSCVVELLLGEKKPQGELPTFTDVMGKYVALRHYFLNVSNSWYDTTFVPTLRGNPVDAYLDEWAHAPRKAFTSTIVEITIHLF